MSKYTDILLEIYEAEIYGDITKEERDFLITEMKTKEEYRERKLKKRYNYNDKDKTIEINGKRRKFIEDKNEYIASTQRFNNDIRYSKNLFKLKHPKSADFVLQHEYGHSVEEGHWNSVYHDVIDDAEKFADKIKDSNHELYNKITKIINSSDEPYTTTDAPRAVHILIRKLTEAGVPNLSKHNKDIREFDKTVVTPTYKKYGVKNRHGRSLEEYHADLHATNAVGTKTAKNALNDFDKFDRGNSNENTARRKVIKKNTKELVKDATKRR